MRVTQLTILFATFAVLTAGLGAPRSSLAAKTGTILHVDDNAPPGGNGASWNSAFRFLQDALAAAIISPNPVSEIRVAQGVYKADRNAANPGGSGDRLASFHLLNSLALKGGYRGPYSGTRGDPDDRDILQFETILSGDLAGDDGPAGSCDRQWDERFGDY